MKIEEKTNQPRVKEDTVPPLHSGQVVMSRGGSLHGLDNLTVQESQHKYREHS